MSGFSILLQLCGGAFARVNRIRASTRRSISRPVRESLESCVVPWFVWRAWRCEFRVVLSRAVVVLPKPWSTVVCCVRCAHRAITRPQGSRFAFATLPSLPACCDLNQRNPVLRLHTGFRTRSILTVPVTDWYVRLPFNPAFSSSRAVVDCVCCIDPLPIFVLLVPCCSHRLTRSLEVLIANESFDPILFGNHLPFSHVTNFRAVGFV